MKRVNGGPASAGLERKCCRRSHSPEMEREPDIHVGHGVAVDLVAVVEGVAEGDEGGEEAIEVPSSQMEIAGRIRELCWGELVWEYTKQTACFPSRRAISIAECLFNKPPSTNAVNGGRPAAAGLSASRADAEFGGLLLHGELAGELRRNTRPQ